MTAKKIKIALVGAGWVAREHLKVLKSLPQVDVVGITSRTLAKAQGLAGEFGICGVFKDLPTLVRESQPDALLILVSEDQMFEVATAAMKFGVPLFIEKPAGLTPQQNLKLAREAKRRKVRTMVGFNRRYYSIFHKGLKIIRQHGELLGIFVEGHERMWRVRDAKKFSKKVLDQWIYANSTHTIDLLRFFGGPIKFVKSISKRSFGEARGDQFAALIELKSGALGQYQAYWYSPGGWRVVLYGNGVTVEFKPLENGTWIDKNFVQHPIKPDAVDNKFKPGFYHQMIAFLKMVRGEKSTWPSADLEDSYQTMLLTEKISQGR